LTRGTTYYVRAFATNAIGTSYGSQVTFKTLTDPTVSTVAASNVATTTARLNANVTYNGEQACDIRFAYDNVTRANFADYAHITTWVNNTYNTGSLPYYDASSLTASTTYYFNVQIRNDVSTDEGSELSFTTTSGISQPASLTLIPGGTTVSAVWPKGVGSTYSVLRYSPATYPTTTADGTLGYLGVGNSVQITALTPGTTYYWSIWGMSGGTYSTSYTTGICTTLAYDSTSTSTNSFTTPTTPIVGTPSASKVDDLPWAQAIQDISDANGMPVNMIWYLLWFFVGVGGGIILYNRMPGQYNLNMTVAAEALWFGFGVTMGLIMLLIPFILILIAVGFIIFGNRH